MNISHRSVKEIATWVFGNSNLSKENRTILQFEANGLLASTEEISLISCVMNCKIRVKREQHSIIQVSVPIIMKNKI